MRIPSCSASRRARCGAREAYPTRRVPSPRGQFLLFTHDELSARDGLVTGPHLLHQRSKDGGVQRGELQQARVQTLQLRLRQRLKIDTPTLRLLARTLQATQENLGGTENPRPPAPRKTTLDLRVTRGSRIRRVARCAGSARCFRGDRRTVLLVEGEAELHIVTMSKHVPKPR